MSTSCRSSPGMRLDIFAAFIIFCLLLLLRLRKQRYQYPPGPRGTPLLGVARQHPKSEFWKTYAQWGRQYGNNQGIISFHVLGRRIVVINSRKVAEDLLDHRGSIYSDRPFPTMSGRLMRREKSIFLMPYNERAKTYRKLMHQSFNARAAHQYWPLQEREACILLGGLLQSPGNLVSHLRRNAGAVILKIAYGYSVEPDHDHFISLAEESMRVGSLAAEPGKWIVDSFPILRFIPSWFPGAGFKQKAKEWGHQLYTQSLEPHEYVKREMASGKAAPSFTSQLLGSDDAHILGYEHEDITLWTAGALYTGGSDTTVSAVHTFFFAMILHPEVQRLAQREVDAIIGSDRLPKLTDRGSLPYVDALIKEVLRWGTVSPMALPHTTAADDVYNGYLIPKGCSVIPNLWAMLHDESVYSDPMKFDPARFTGKHPEPDPRELAFGRGRRVCPGQHIAEASVFIQVVSVLATFDVLRDVDRFGREIEPEVSFTSAIVSHVKPFKCRIIPRSDRMRLLIQQALEEL